MCRDHILKRAYGLLDRLQVPGVTVRPPAHELSTPYRPLGSRTSRGSTRSLERALQSTHSPSLRSWDRGVSLEEGNQARAERYQHEEPLRVERDFKTEVKTKDMTDTKGKTTSIDRLARKNIKPTIVMLKDCCGLSSGSKHVLVDETKSRLHWLVEGGQQFVEKNKEGTLNPLGVGSSV